MIDSCILCFEDSFVDRRVLYNNEGYGRETDCWKFSFFVFDRIVVNPLIRRYNCIHFKNKKKILLINFILKQSNFVYQHGKTCNKNKGKNTKLCYFITKCEPFSSTIWSHFKYIVNYVQQKVSNKHYHLSWLINHVNTVNYDFKRWKCSKSA
jgi:hypothetical protein